MLERMLLTREAWRERRRMTRELRKAGLLMKVDQVALNGYCQAWAHWVLARVSRRA